MPSSISRKILREENLKRRREEIFESIPNISYPWGGEHEEDAIRLKPCPEKGNTYVYVPKVESQVAGAITTGYYFKTTRKSIIRGMPKKRKKFLGIF